MNKKTFPKFTVIIFAAIFTSISLVANFIPGEAYAEKVLSSTNYSTLAKKTQAQALHKCLTGASVWSGKLEDYKGNIFEPSSTDKAQFLWYGNSYNNYQFNRADGNCNSLFGGSYPTEFTVNAPEKYKANKADEIKAKLVEIGYKESNGRYYIDATAALKHFTGYNGSTMLFDEKEAMQLIAFYINSNSPIGYGGFAYYDGDETKACDVAGSSKASDAATSAANSGAEYTWLNVSTTKRCSVKAEQPSNGIMVYTVNSGRYNGAAGTQKTFKELINQWNVYVDYMWTDPEGQEGEDLIGNETIDPTTGEEITGDGSAGALDGCFGNSGALGWIICPVIKFVGSTLEGIYSMIIENYLTMGAATVSDTAVNEAWGKFQGYANIIFSILLIFVVLSQLTGIGLNNYGIKKVLPKLIITVILVNASFILCAVAIDLSNIVGSSINDFLGGLDVGGLGASDFNLATFVANTFESLFSVGGTAVGLFIAGKAITLAGGWSMLILPLLLALLSALIGIIFFFILLGVRQAAIILLLVISPVAIVCYALPNTKHFFDRWLKMFSSLLLVYPICGIMMGGGNFASRVLLTAGADAGFMYYLVAMLVQVVPFFMIPSVLKSSMTALGGLGAKIAGAGDKLSGFTTRSIRNSRAYQEHQQEALRNSNMIRNKNIMDKTKLSKGEQARLDALRAKPRNTLTSSERKELKQLGGRQYRYARAAAARERGVMEDAMADVASRREMLEHGSARYEKIVAGAMREQRNKDDAGQVALYEEGKVTAFDGSGKIIKGDSLGDLAEEHLALLKHVADHPTDEAAASKLRAVETMLGKMGPNGFDKMEDNFGNLMANHSQFDDTDPSAAHLDGLRIASSHLSRNFAGQIKANSRAFDAMLNDINTGGKLQHQTTFSQQEFINPKGGKDKRYVSDHYGSRGALSLKAENVNDLGDAYYDNLLHATMTGKLNGSDLEQVLRVFDEAEMAADAGKLTLKGEVRKRMKAIKDVAYAVSQKNGDPRTEGSRMIGTAGSAGIDSIVKQIADAKDWSAMNAQERQQYSSLVNNITDSLKQDAHTVENVRQLQAALANARTKNIETAVSGGSLIDQVNTADLHSYKIPRGSKQKVVMPADWDKVGDNWINKSTGAPLSAAEAAKAEKILEHNASVDIEQDNI